MSVREIEVLLTGVEDEILDSLSYREYDVQVGTTTLVPKPEVQDVLIDRVSDRRYTQYVNQLGNNGNPINFYKVFASRLIDEAVLRQQEYWTITRGTYAAQGLPIEIRVLDSRIEILIAIIKIISV